MARRQWREFQPGFSPATYTREGLSSLSSEEIKHEYARVRREVQERLRSFSRSKDPTAKQREFYKQGKDVMLTIKEIEKSSDPRGLMEDLLREGMRMINSPRSTWSGSIALDEKLARSLNAHYGTEENPKPFKGKDMFLIGQMMDYAKDRKDSKTYGSGTRMDAAELSAKAGVSLSDFKRHYKYYVEQVQGGADKIIKYSDSKKGKAEAAKRRKRRKK